ncbi:hypothetical protein DTW91_04845 [Chryseobacterium sp. SC28]|nr:hypothetical protein DTW91_04845 [Chryseobacterium sp. SC28]
MKEGADLTIYNETPSDIFIIDKFSFDQSQENKKLEIFSYGYYANTNKIRPYLNQEYITMYTNKTIFFPITEYNDNKVYDYLTFYFIKKENLEKTKQELNKNKLYDSINIDLNKFHPKGNDNHLYFGEKKIEFKNY